MAAVTIREAKPADAQTIAEIHVAAWQVAYRELLPKWYLDKQSVEKRRDFWQDLLSNPGPSKVALSEEANGITGFCSYGPTRDDDLPGTAEIYAIYIRPDKWRSGAGRALCGVAFRDAALRECTSITAWVFRDNPAARAFYERLGFISDGAARTENARIDTSLHEMRYRKAIA